jgi:hypothetical protein
MMIWKKEIGADFGGIIERMWGPAQIDYLYSWLQRVIRVMQSRSPSPIQFSRLGDSRIFWSHWSEQNQIALRERRTMDKDSGSSSRHVHLPMRTNYVQRDRGTYPFDASLARGSSLGAASRAMVLGLSRCVPLLVIEYQQDRYQRDTSRGKRGKGFATAITSPFLASPFL